VQFRAFGPIGVLDHIAWWNEVFELGKATTHLQSLDVGRAISANTQNSAQKNTHINFQHHNLEALVSPNSIGRALVSVALMAGHKSFAHNQAI
jgi:hypothetical protein